MIDLVRKRKERSRDAGSRHLLGDGVILLLSQLVNAQTLITKRLPCFVIRNAKKAPEVSDQFAGAIAQQVLISAEYFAREKMRHASVRLEK